MTEEEAIKILNVIIYIIPKEYCNEETEGAIEMAINSLEAWEKVKEDLRKFIDANKNSGDMYLEGRADGGWHALAAIRRCLGEIEDEIQTGDGGCQGPDQGDTGSVQG
jgi:hypothetical protein